MGASRVDDRKQCTQLGITQKDQALKAVGMILNSSPLVSVRSPPSDNTGRSTTPAQSTP